MRKMDEQEAQLRAAARRLKVAIEILGDHAWVRTWIAHTAVEKLLDVLITRTTERDDAEKAVVSAQDREAEADRRLLDLLECGHCHEVENAHAVGFYCMVHGEVLPTVYTPRVAFDRITGLEKREARTVANLATGELSDPKFAKCLYCGSEDLKPEYPWCNSCHAKLEKLDPHG